MWQRDHVHIHLHIEDHLGINDVHFDGVLCKGWLRTMSRRMAKHPIDIYIYRLEAIAIRLEAIAIW